MDLGLRQRQVAAQLGANPETLRNWELGHTQMAVRFYPAVIRFLGYDPLPERITLGEQVRAKRMRLGISQKELARILGVDESSVWRVEHDRRLWKRKLRRVFRTYADEESGAAP